jgi:hypothetical protein
VRVLGWASAARADGALPHSLSLSLCLSHHARAQITRIKEKVEEQSGVPPPQQRLIFSGRQLCVLTLSLVCVCVG